MFAILCYDVETERNAKVKKIVRQYFRPIQKSVCEGFITEGKLKKLYAQLKPVLDPAKDSVVVYKFASTLSFEKMCIGQSNGNEDLII